MLSSVASLLPAPVWILISVGFYSIAEYVSKTWANSPTSIEVAIVLCANALSGLFWLPALFSENRLADMGTAWLVLAALATLILGLGVFKEHLTSLQWVGVLLALVAFLLLTSNH